VVRTTLAAAHGQRGQGVLEDLFEGQELEHAQVDRRMEAQTALVRADGTAHLDAVAAVDVHSTGVVDPRYPEQDGALGLDHALEDASLEVFGVGFEERPEAANDLFHRLMEFRLVGITLLQASEEGINGLDHGIASKR